MIVNSVRMLMAIINETRIRLFACRDGHRHLFARQRSTITYVDVRRCGRVTADCIATLLLDHSHVTLVHDVEVLR